MLFEAIAIGWEYDGRRKRGLTGLEDGDDKHRKAEEKADEAGKDCSRRLSREQCVRAFAFQRIGQTGRRGRGKTAAAAAAADSDPGESPRGRKSLDGTSMHVPWFALAEPASRRTIQTSINQMLASRIGLSLPSA